MTDFRRELDAIFVHAIDVDYDGIDKETTDRIHRGEEENA
jgi:hypothetical protein